MGYVIWVELRGSWGLFCGCWSPFLPYGREHVAQLGHVTHETISPASLPPLKNMQWLSTGEKPTTVMLCPEANSSCLSLYLQRKWDMLTISREKNKLKVQWVLVLVATVTIPGHPCWMWLCPFPHHPDMFSNTPVSLLACHSCSLPPVYYGALYSVCLMIYCSICSYHLPEELVFLGL